MSHPPHEQPFDLQRKGSGGGGRTRRTKRAPPRRAVRGATQVAPRTARDIPDPSCAKAQRRQMSVKAHRTTDAQTTEPGHHNGEFVKDVRVSPIDEGVGVVEKDELSRAARRPRTGASGSPPRSRRTTRSRRRDSRNCGHRAPRGCPADFLLRVPWVHFVSEEKCVKKKCQLREPGETDSARAPKFKCQEITIFRKPPPTTKPLTRYQNCSSKSGACVDLMNATLHQRIPRSTMIAQLGGTELSRVVSNATKQW